MAASAPVTAIDGLSGQRSGMDLSKSDCTYTYCYCEENVYMLCRQLAELGIAKEDLSDLVVVFISNASRKVLLWRQQAGNREGGQVCWDYHVLCIQAGTRKGREPGPWVWDIDSQLPFPTPLQHYVREALWAGLNLRRPSTGHHSRLYRLIGGPEYLRHFASDRSHMLNPKTHEWLQPPPTYECIVAQDGTVNNLQSYISMGPKDVERRSQSPQRENGPILGHNAEEGAVVGTQIDKESIPGQGLEALVGKPTGIVLDEEGMMAFFGMESKCWS